MEISDKNITKLSWEGKAVLLVGTAHVSRESARLVKELIEGEKPDTVCVELCASRYQSLRQKSQWQNMDIIKVIKEKKAFLLLSNLLLASFQRRIAKKFDINPGEEMLKAIEAADLVGAEIVTADRDIRVTLLRTWRNLAFFDKLKMIFQMILSVAGGIDEVEEEDIERMKQEDILEMLIADIGKAFPVIRKILIDERDLYLAENIRKAPGEKIVAVVGAGHVPGIKAHWEDTIDTKALESVPRKGRITGLLKWILPVLILLLFILGFFYGGMETGKSMIFWWFAVNGVMAGLGAILALAHPLTILSSILAAPLTSLNPMIAAGWVSGLVEALSRKPKVIDFENIYEDIASVKGFWKNNVTRILLVVLFTNLGSMIGSFVALPLIIKIFGSLPAPV